MMTEQSHPFWSTQNVKLVDKQRAASSSSMPEQQPSPVTAVEDGSLPGLIVDVKTGDMTPDRAVAAPLPDGFEWCTLDCTSVSDMQELTQFLADHYIEDQSNQVRLHYSQGLLQWALSPPGTPKSFAAGVRVNQRLVGFISAILVQLPSQPAPWLQVDFLCVHRKLRSKRLAAVLINEIVRRGINEAARYTCGFFTSALTSIPIEPMCSVECWERILKPVKMFQCGYGTNFMLQNQAKYTRRLSMDKHKMTNRLIPMTEAHLPQVMGLLNGRSARFRAVYDLAATRHWMLPRPGVVESFVVLDQPAAKQKSQSKQQLEHKGGPAPIGVAPVAPVGAGASTESGVAVPVVKQFISYFLVESKMLQHPLHNSVQLAYLWYHHAPTSDQLRTLVKDVMIHAAGHGVDMLICHNQDRNQAFIEALQFGLSPSRLNCYTYNYQVQLQPRDIGIVMI